MIVAEGLCPEQGAACCGSLDAAASYQHRPARTSGGFPLPALRKVHARAEELSVSDLNYLNSALPPLRNLLKARGMRDRFC